MQTPLDVPAAWEKLDLSAARGVLFVVGATDTGKTTFARYLHARLAAAGYKVALLDGDPGQSSLGPPATLTVSFQPQQAFEQAALPAALRYFVGSTSGRGHLLPLVVGGARLAQACAADVVVYDTCGLISPQGGGLALKLALIELLQPWAVFALQHDRELEPLLAPLRRLPSLRLFELEPSAAAYQRSSGRRRQHRRTAFARYFQHARSLDLTWTHLAVLPAPRFTRHRLVGLLGPDGFLQALGIVLEIDPDARRLRLLTPLKSLQGVRAIRVGDMEVEPGEYREVLK